MGVGGKNLMQGWGIAFAIGIGVSGETPESPHLHLFPNKDSTKCAAGSSPFVRKEGIVTPTMASQGNTMHRHPTTISL